MPDNNFKSSSDFPYYIPNANIVQNWNSKRILPPVLLSQYTPYCIVFLIQDQQGSFLDNDIIDESNSILLGSPRDTAYNLTNEYYNNPNNFESINTNPVKSSTLYYSQAILPIPYARQDNQYKLHSLGGINAVIKGYIGGDDTVQKLIPLTVKLSQLTQPDSKNILEVSQCGIRCVNVNGYVEVNLTLESHDIHQLFSRKSVVSKIFNNFTKYLVCIGWQGPRIEDVQLQAKSLLNAKSVVQVGNNSLEIVLNDGVKYNLILPSPLVKLDGTFNLPLNKSEDAYIIDTDNTDNGNRLFVPIFGTTPDISFQGTKVSFSFRGTSAFKGMKANQALVLLFGGNGTEAIRTILIDRLNNFIKPIATYDIKNFFNRRGTFDAESQQATVESFATELKFKDGAGEGIRSGIGAPENIIIESEEDKKNKLKKKQDEEERINREKEEKRKKLEKDKKLTEEESKKENKKQEEKVSKQLSSNISIKPGKNVDNLSPEAKKELLRLDSIIHKFGQKVEITSGKRRVKGVKSNHNTGNAIDIVASNRNRQDSIALGRFLKENGFDANFEYKGQRNPNNPKSPVDADHVHVNLGFSSSSNDDILDEEQGLSENENDDFVSDSEIDTSKPTIDDVVGDNTLVINPDTGEVTSGNINQLLKNTNNKSSSSYNPSSNTNEAKNKKGFDEIPAAYRLGDVITTILDAVDDLNFYDSNNTDAIKGELSKAKIEELEINGNKIKVADLQDKDIFDTSAGNINFSRKSDAFTNAVEQEMNKQGVNLFSADYNYQGLQRLLAEIKKASEYMSESIGYEIVSKGISDEQTRKWKNMLEIFRDTSCGTKYNSIKNKVSKNKFPAMYEEYKYKIFKWERNYEEKLNSDSDFPITVADLPVSVDTFTRCLQTMVNSRSCEDIINSILSAVSNDYGFTLRMYHRTPGTNPDGGDINNDFSNVRSSYYNKGRSIDDEHGKIMFIIDDEFFTDEKIIEVMKQQTINEEEFTNLATGKANISGEFNIFMQNMQGMESQMKDSLLLQDQILNNEYSSKKLNNAFIIDYGSLHSLVKSISFSKIDGQYNIPSQLIYEKIYKAMQSVNGGTIPANILHGTDVVKNLSGIQNDISKYIINKLKIMPGKQEYEYKLLQINTEVIEALNGNKSEKNSGFLQEEGSMPKLEDIKTQLNDRNVFQKDEDRKEFLNAFVSNYIYNRPLGVKYSFYLGKMNATIHGTAGLGICQGIYVRGIEPRLEGLYRITALQHTVNIQGGTFETNIDAVLINSNIFNQTNKLIARLAN